MNPAKQSLYFSEGNGSVLEVRSILQVTDPMRFHQPQMPSVVRQVTDVAVVTKRSL